MLAEARQNDGYVGPLEVWAPRQNGAMRAKISDTSCRLRFRLFENMRAHFWQRVADRRASSLAAASRSVSGNKCP
jgi:hypothetical protein